MYFWKPWHHMIYQKVSVFIITAKLNFAFDLKYTCIIMTCLNTLGWDAVSSEQHHCSSWPVGLLGIWIYHIFCFQQKCYGKILGVINVPIRNMDAVSIRMQSCLYCICACCLCSKCLCRPIAYFGTG